MPALTAAAAAAAIAQISLNPGGLLPHLAPYLQSYLPPAPQPVPLQQQMLFERRHHTASAPQPNIFNKMAFAQQATRPIRCVHLHCDNILYGTSNIGVPFAKLHCTRIDHVSCDCSDDPAKMWQRVKLLSPIPNKVLLHPLTAVVTGLP